MKTKIHLFAGTALLLIIVLNFIFLPSCGWDDPCYRNFGVHTTNKVTVDRADLYDDTIFSTETQGVLLWATVGTNSGYAFKGLEVIRNTNTVDITVWNSLDIPCGEKTTDTTIALSGYIYNISPPHTAGYNSVVIHQPDGSTLTRNYFVR